MFFNLQGNKFHGRFLIFFNRFFNRGFSQFQQLFALVF